MSLVVGVEDAPSYLHLSADQGWSAEFAASSWLSSWIPFPWMTVAAFLPLVLMLSKWKREKSTCKNVGSSTRTNIVASADTNIRINREGESPELIVDGCNGPLRLLVVGNTDLDVELRDVQTGQRWDSAQLICSLQQHFSKVTIYFDGLGYPKQKTMIARKQLGVELGRNEEISCRLVLTDDEADHVIVGHVGGYSMEVLKHSDDQQASASVLRIVRTETGPGKQRRWLKPEGLVQPNSVGCLYRMTDVTRLHSDRLRRRLPPALAKINEVCSIKAVVVTDDVFLRQRVIDHAAIMSFQQLTLLLR